MPADDLGGAGISTASSFMEPTGAPVRFPVGRPNASRGAAAPFASWEGDGLG